MAGKVMVGSNETQVIVIPLTEDISTVSVPFATFTEAAAYCEKKGYVIHNEAAVREAIKKEEELLLAFNDVIVPPYTDERKSLIERIECPACGKPLSEHATPAVQVKVTRVSGYPGDEKGIFVEPKDNKKGTTRDDS